MVHIPIFIFYFLGFVGLDLREVISRKAGQEGGEYRTGYKQTGNNMNSPRLQVLFFFSLSLINEAAWFD
jgi:hypothetical protein